MANPAIPRDEVHTLAEACSDEGALFQASATRLIRDQRRLSRFVEQQVGALEPMSAQVALYMLSVVLRIFEQVGGRMRKVTGADLDAATARIAAATDSLLPADDAFVERAKALEWRAQPHILDEVLWALYEREDGERKDEEVKLDPAQSAMIYLVLWAAVEALDANWNAPRT